MGYTVDKLAVKAHRRDGYFILNHLVHVGKHTYINPKLHGKMFDVVSQLLGDELRDMGKTVVMDSEISLLKVAREDLGKIVVTTASGNN